MDGTHYLTMACIPGKPLSSLINPKKILPPRQVAMLVRKIAQALAEAHKHGVIHRDLKPANVMLDQRNEPVVMDFGLARQMKTGEDARLTQDGAILGTPVYMAPEQVRGELDQIGPASDIYALGVMLYQFLSGELPFSGPIMSVLAQVLTEQPKRPSEVRTGVDPTLETICLKMMAKEVNQRYGSMKEVVTSLSEFLRTGPASSVKIAESVTEELLPIILTEAPGRRPSQKPHLKAAGGIRRPRTRTILMGAAGFAFLLLLGEIVTLWIRSGDAVVKIEIHADDVEVTFQNETIKLADGTQEYRVTPGEHTLHVRSGKSGDNAVSEEFDTEKFTLRKGDKPTVIVTLEDSEVVATLDGKVIGRRSFAPNTTGQSNAATGEASPTTNEPEMPASPGQNAAPVPFTITTPAPQWTEADIQAGRIKAPDLSILKPVWDDDFTSRKSGVRTGNGKGDIVISTKDGALHFDVNKGEWFWAETLRGVPKLDEFACRVVAKCKSTGKGFRGWRFMLTDGGLKGIEFVLQRDARLVIKPSRGGDARTFPIIAHPAIKAETENNEILVIYRSQRLEIYVNGVAVCSPIDWQSDLRKARITIGIHGVTGAHAEYDSFTMWSATEIPSLEERIAKSELPTPINAVPAVKVTIAEESTNPDWNPTTVRELLTLTGHTSEVYSVDFSPDGKRLASASYDGTVKVWDATNGQETLTLRGHTDYVMSVAFNPDGKRLASASSDGTVKVWDATNGQETLTLKGHPLPRLERGVQPGRETAGVGRFLWDGEGVGCHKRSGHALFESGQLRGGFHERGV